MTSAKSVKPKAVQPKVSAKPKKTTTARSSRAKSEQKAEKVDKPLSASQKLDAIGEEAIFEMVADCTFYEDIAKKADVSRHALMRWLGTKEDMYAQAREARADKMAEEIIAISDDSSRDTIIDDDGNERTNQEVVARSRLRVDSRKWLASKMLPKKYGDKQDINHGGQADNPITAFLLQCSGKSLPIIPE